MGASLRNQTTSGFSAFALAGILLICSASQALGAEDFRELRTSGVRLEVPAFFQPASDAAAWRDDMKQNRDFDGERLSSNDGKIELSVYTLGANAQEMKMSFDQQWAADSRTNMVQRVTYKAKKADWYVVSGFDERDWIFYLKVIRSGNRRAEFVVAFEKAQEARIGPLLDRISKSFAFSVPAEPSGANTAPREEVDRRSKDVVLQDLLVRCEKNWVLWNARKERMTAAKLAGQSPSPAELNELKAIGSKTISIAGEVQRLLRSALDRGDNEFALKIQAQFNSHYCGFRI